MSKGEAGELKLSAQQGVAPPLTWAGVGVALAEDGLQATQQEVRTGQEVHAPAHRSPAHLEVHVRAWRPAAAWWLLAELALAMLGSLAGLWLRPPRPGRVRACGSRPTCRTFTCSWRPVLSTCTASSWEMTAKLWPFTSRICSPT